MRKKRLIEARPNYYRGQLLLEDDFLAEQNYHLNARRRHNLNLHGWGVVRGLEVLPRDDNSVTVNPGFAIDERGRDMPVDQAENLDLSEFGPNDLVKVGLAYDEEPSEGPSDDRRKECYAVLTASRVTEEDSVLILATVQLDGQGKVRNDAIDYSRTRYAHPALPPGSITPSELAPELRTGWLRMPFRPIPMVDLPEGESKIPDAFRVGVTRALTPHRKPGEEETGAGGTMAIEIPPSVKRIIRFRIAGKENEGQIIIELFLGGWDAKNNKHLKESLLKKTIGSAPFLETYEISDRDTFIDPEYNTLSLWLRATDRASISLIAIEFSY